MGDTRRGYAICGTPRSGTNLLVAYLKSTGVLGQPAEYFNVDDQRRWQGPDYPDNLQLQLQKVLELGSSANGVFGLKVFAEDADRFIAAEGHEVLPNLRFVHVERDDLLGQAISWVRARQTWRWSTLDEARGQSRYDGPAIMAALRKLIEGQARWRFWFARKGIEPLRLRYEAIVVDPQAAIDAIVALVGLNEPARLASGNVGLDVQRDAETEQWRARFLAAYGPSARF